MISNKLSQLEHLRDLNTLSNNPPELSQEEIDLAVDITSRTYGDKKSLYVYTQRPEVFQGSH